MDSGNLEKKRCGGLDDAADTSGEHDWCRLQRKAFNTVNLQSRNERLKRHKVSSWQGCQSLLYQKKKIQSHCST